MQSEKPARKRQAIGLPTDVQAILATSQAIETMMSTAIYSDGSLKPEAFRALLKLKDINLEQFAQSHGVTGAMIHRVINRQERSQRLELALAELLGLAPERVWGSRVTKSVA